jgi:hypothetical protein
MDHQTGSSRHRQLTNGQDTWSARCGESRTPGAASGSGKRTGRKASTAPRPDSTGKLRRCTDKSKVIVEFYLNLAAALTVIRRLINRARSLYRWPTRPTTRRLR